MLRITLALTLAAASLAAQVSVLSNRYNNSRTGANLSETVLTPANVNPQQFGKIFRYQVDGSVFAQPLYIPNVSIPGKGTHNVLFVCTMNDSVYAFDADKAQTLWSVNFTNPAAGVTPVPIVDIVGHKNGDIVSLVGIVSTPVIDPSTQTLYLVARTKETGGSGGATYIQRIHALSLTTGAEKFNGPVVISGSVPGTGQGSVNGIVSFDPKMNNQRLGLALANGQLIIGWSSHEDTQPYHGWVMSYSASTLKQTGIFCDTPDGSEGGIWQSGRAPVVDSTGNVYLFTGNGTTDQPSDFSEAALRFTTNNGLKLADYFVASNFNSLNAADLDLAGSGPILMPGTNFLVGGGKAGEIYLLNAADLGKYSSGDQNIPQKFQATQEQIRPGPAFWTSDSHGPLLYLWGENEPLKAFHFNGSSFDTTPLLQGVINTPTGQPGATISISSNGTTDASGIVWASLPAKDYEDTGLVQGVLHALNASDPTQDLWNSTQNASRDSAGYFAKFVPPLVVNGKMYMPTFSDYTTPNYVNVYGLLSPAKQFTVTAATPSFTVLQNGTGNLQVNVSPVPGHSFTGTVNFSVSGLPAGATASFAPNPLVGSGNTTLVVTTANAALGSYPLTITGVGAGSGLSSQTTATLTVSNLPGVISLDIVGKATPMVATDFAGVVLKSHWNNMLGGTQPNPQPLVDENGNATTATATWVANAPYLLPIANTPPNFTMMQGYFDSGDSGTVTFSVTNLPAAPNGYNVYVYADGDNGGSTRSTQYTVSGPAVTSSNLTLTDAANTNFSGVFNLVTSTQPLGNYMVFQVPGPDFTITAVGVDSSDGRLLAPMNGLQIVAQ